MCTSSGRQCEYRETPDRRTRASRLVPIFCDDSHTMSLLQVNGSPAPSCPLVPGGLMDLTSEELWYLTYFRKVTSLQCSAYFFDEFWERLVHQASEIQPAVRHAAIGMGALNWQFTQLRIGTNSGSLDRQFSLQQCNKAINHLQKNLADDQMGRAKVETALVTCLVLVCVILFQEEPEAAGRHLRAGKGLLTQYLCENPYPTSVSTALKQTFAATQLVYTTFANKIPEKEDLESPWLVPDKPSNNKDNLQKLHDLLVTLARMIMQNDSRGFRVISSDPDLDLEPFAVMTKLRGWSTQLKATLAVHKDLMGQKDVDALTLLELWGEVLAILIAVNTRVQPLQMKYDSLLLHFKKVVYLAEILLAHTGQGSKPTFPVKTGIVPALFFCVFKCRDWLVRQQALDLLHKWQFLDGDSSVSPMVLVLQRTIEIEMQGLTPEDVVPESSRVESIIVETPPKKSDLHFLYRLSRYTDANLNIDQPWREEWVVYALDQPKIMRH